MIKRKRILAILWLILCAPCLFANEKTPSRALDEFNGENVVQYWYRNFEASHSYALLALALKKTEDLYGKTHILPSPEMTQGRALALLEQGANDYIDIINVVPDDHRIDTLRPIYIAGEEGLVGRRLCVIRKGTESLFEGVRTLNDLKKAGVVIGQGAHWPDTQILRDHGVSVMTSVSFEDLFQMLEKERFDCYLRGAHEISEDMANYGNDRLTIEPKLLFVYPSASIFFVGKTNTQLAERVELGLRRAILDRDYHKLFNQNYANEIERLSLSKRRIIRLNNSLLSNDVILKSTHRSLKIDGKIDD